MTAEHLVWRKSSHSDEEFNCVEVACVGAEGLAVRDSKSPEGGVLVLGQREWRALCGVLGGRG